MKMWTIFRQPRDPFEHAPPWARALREQLKTIIKQGENTLIALSDLAAVEAAEKADLTTLTGLVTQILTAVASGSLDQVGAQALLTAMNSDDATVKSNIATIQGALPTPPSTPATS